jgi:hypothetical protein
MSDLQRLEQQAINEPTPQVLEHLQKVELEIDLLRKQCKSPRHYVASSIEGSEVDQSSPSRRRKIMLKVTNSVTTIIKGKAFLMCTLNNNFLFPVVEDALKRQAKSKKSKKSKATAEPSTQELTQLHRRLSELQSSAAEDFDPSDQAVANPSVKVEDTVDSPIRQVMTEVPETKRDPQIESLIESAIQVRQEIDSMIGDKEMPVDGYDQLLQSSMVWFLLGNSDF